ncbi:MAG: adenylyltransferase/cytidyltransferase family protein, partial [Candidatus Poribacteria bacterium]|nr:adenylyltransferase/cytidyltransferase family protein [Candidatus Poribacteria bacterium]
MRDHDDTGNFDGRELLMRIAIMGGTFNPIHYAHLLSAEQVYDRLDFDKVLFVPSARPPHKDNGDIIDSEHR